MRLKHIGQLLRESHCMVTLRACILYGRQTPLGESGRAVLRNGRRFKGYDYLRLCDDFVVIRQEEQPSAVTVRERKG